MSLPLPPSYLRTSDLLPPVGIPDHVPGKGISVIVDVWPGQKVIKEYYPSDSSEKPIADRDVQVAICREHLRSRSEELKRQCRSPEQVKVLKKVFSHLEDGCAIRDQFSCGINNLKERAPVGNKEFRLIGKIADHLYEIDCSSGRFYLGLQVNCSEEGKPLEHRAVFIMPAAFAHYSQSDFSSSCERECFVKCSFVSFSDIPYPAVAFCVAPHNTEFIEQLQRVKSIHGVVQRFAGQRLKERREAFLLAFKTKFPKHIFADERSVLIPAPDPYKSKIEPMLANITFQQDMQGAVKIRLQAVLMTKEMWNSFGEIRGLIEHWAGVHKVALERVQVGNGEVISGAVYDETPATPEEFMKAIEAIQVAYETYMEELLVVMSDLQVSAQPDN